MLGQSVTAHLGNLHFGGTIVMVCGTAETREYVVELPCLPGAIGQWIRVGEVT